MKKDVAQLATADLADFDPAWVTGDHDIDEPLMLEGVRLVAADMVHLHGVPFTADGCHISSSDLSVALLVATKNTLFSACKLRATRFHKFVRNAWFSECQLQECSFRMMTLDAVSFAESQLKQCDFYGSELMSVTFPGTTFQGVGFDACTLTDVDLSEAADLMVGDPRTLAGSRLADHQVHLIAHRLAELSGIQVGPTNQ